MLSLNARLDGIVYDQIVGLIAPDERLAIRANVDEIAELHVETVLGKSTGNGISSSDDLRRRQVFHSDKLPSLVRAGKAGGAEKKDSEPLHEPSVEQEQSNDAVMLHSVGMTLFVYGKFLPAEGSKVLFMGEGGERLMCRPFGTQTSVNFYPGLTSWADILCIRGRFQLTEDRRAPAPQSTSGFPDNSLN